MTLLKYFSSFKKNQKNLILLLLWLLLPIFLNFFFEKKLSFIDHLSHFQYF